MGSHHCSNINEANRFIKILKKTDKRAKNAHVKKKRNKDGSYIVYWTVYAR